MTDLTEEAASLLAVLVLGVKNGHVSIDEAIGRAYRSGEIAGQLRGIERAQQVFNGGKE